MNSVFSSRLLRSRVCSNEVGKSERIFGYFVGPCLVYMVYGGLAGVYLTQFYTDVLGLAGGLLTLMPLVSKLLSSAASLVIGRMIDHTRTAQGKARPWLLASGIMLTVCGFLLYAVPRVSYRLQLVWVVVSYNLFFGLAFAVYSLSHSMMVPLSTRDIKQRDGLAMLSSMGISMIPGMLTTVFMPFLVSYIGVGTGARGSWLTFMSILSIIAIPAVLLEFYFTRERITEETALDDIAKASVPFAKQVSACFHNRYWVMIILFTLVLQLCSGLSTGSMLYFCNWVLSNSVSAGAAKQLLVNVVGQGPMGYGVFLLWPLVRKLGKRRVTIAGFLLAVAGSVVILLGGDSLPLVLTGLLVRSVGALPTYVSAAFLAEALDHAEIVNGFRSDGFTASVSSIIQSFALGLSQTLLLGGIALFGYISPESAAQAITQPEPVRVFFRLCFAGAPLLGYAVCAVIMCFFDLEKPLVCSKND